MKIVVLGSGANTDITFTLDVRGGEEYEIRRNIGIWLNMNKYTKYELTCIII